MDSLNLLISGQDELFTLSVPPVDTVRIPGQYLPYLRSIPSVPPADSVRISGQYRPYL